MLERLRQVRGMETPASHRQESVTMFPRSIFDRPGNRTVCVGKSFLIAVGDVVCEEQLQIMRAGSVAIGFQLK
jgi:hypothetical protein